MNNVDFLAEINPEIIVCDGLDEALVGYIELFDKVVALYDKDRCVNIFMNRDGMSEEDAVEFFYYNVVGAYVGDHTPAFATFFDKKQNNV